MIKIIKRGVSPIKTDIPTKTELIFAAAAFSLTYGEPIHCTCLYGYIQSHLSNKTHENLQGTLEKDSLNWHSLGKGYYSLTNDGADCVSCCEQPDTKIPLGVSFMFTRIIGNRKISVTSDGANGRYTVKINGTELKSTSAIEIIRTYANEPIPVKGTSLPRAILNWILNSHDYTWQIEKIATILDTSNLRK